MENTVYCLATSEPQADEILTHLRNLHFTASQVSILLKDKKTKNISVKEDAIRGARKGAIVGGVLGAIAGLTVLSIPAVMPLMVAGPFIAALEGAAGHAVDGNPRTISHADIAQVLLVDLGHHPHDGSVEYAEQGVANETTVLQCEGLA